MLNGLLSQSARISRVRLDMQSFMPAVHIDLPMRRPAFVFRGVVLGEAGGAVKHAIALITRAAATRKLLAADAAEDEIGWREGIRFPGDALL